MRRAILMVVSFAVVAGPLPAQNPAMENRLARALEFFPDADADGDGKLSMVEALEYLKAHPELSGILGAAQGGKRKPKTVAPAPPLPGASDLPPGPRVFVCAHSFMIYTAAQLPPMAHAAGIGYRDAGRQMIGGSRVIQHWNVPDEENKAKAALLEGGVDVLTLSPHLLLPDEGIDNFAKLGLEKNPKLRVLLQASWPARDGEMGKEFRNGQRDEATVESLRKMGQGYRSSWLKPLEAQVAALNASIGHEAVFIIPVCDAVMALREHIAGGTAPGLTEQTDLFRDDLGHPLPPLAALVTYCHFANIFGRSPVGLPVPADLKALPRAEELNRLLQQIAWDAVTRYPLSGVKADAAQAADVPASYESQSATRPAPAGTPSSTAPSEGDRFPAFSWDRVPLYMHIRKDTAFAADEIRYLASFPLITLEKTTGAREFGSTEEGTRIAARAIKAINPGAKVLYYRNVIVHYGGYAANEALADIPGAFLLDRAGGDKLVRKTVQAYDLSNPRVRDWWLANAMEICSDPAIDGLFLDGVIKILEPDYLRAEIGEEKKASVVVGYEAMAKDARRVLGPKELLVANLLRARLPDSGMGHVRAFDGSYMEGFETAVGNVPVKDYVAQGIVAFQEAARKGFLIAFTTGLGEAVEGDEKNAQLTDEIRNRLTLNEQVQRRFSYLLALFLTCAEKYSYFCAHDGYDAKRSKVWLSRPPEFDRPLGAPKGPAARTGYVYIRNFAHASVRLDVERKTGEIVWMAP